MSPRQEVACAFAAWQAAASELAHHVPDTDGWYTHLGPAMAAWSQYVDAVRAAARPASRGEETPRSEDPVGTGPHRGAGAGANSRTRAPGGTRVVR